MALFLYYYVTIAKYLHTIAVLLQRQTKKEIVKYNLKY